VAGDEAEWTTPLAVVETLLREFSCIKAVQVVEWRCAYYTRFGGELDLAIPANLRYLAELLKLCGRYGKHLSLQLQTDLAHLAADQLAGPLRDLFREYREYVLPQNECIPPSYYLDQAAACGLWLAGDCDHWGMEPQWWWWTKGESYFIRPGFFGVEAEFETDEDRYARLYRAFIIEGALMGATVFSIEPPQDIWHGDGTDPRHFDQVIYPTLRQIIDQRLIATPDEVLREAKVAYQMTECKTVQDYDRLLQDLDLETGKGNLERAAYGAYLPHLMKEMIPDTGGRFYFIPLLPVGTPTNVSARFAKVIQPNECTNPAAYQALLERYFPPTENIPDNRATNRACVLKSGRAVAVLQSRENLFERQAFAVDLPRWVTGLQARPENAGLVLNWTADSAAQSYRIWQRIPGARVYPEWRLLVGDLHTNSIRLAQTGTGTFGVSALTAAKCRWESTVNYGEYLLFNTEESPIMEQAVVTPSGSRTEPVAWTDSSLPASQEVWAVFEGVPEAVRPQAAQVLETYRGLINAYEARDLDRLMSYYAPEYRDANGYGLEYVRRAWRWWYQRTTVPYVVAQVRRWDTSLIEQGTLRFTAWNRFRATMIDDEPFGYHGRVRIPRHDGDRVTWTWHKDAGGKWQLLRTEPALPNFGEMLWNSRGHDRDYQMSDFADPPLTPSKP